MVLGIKECGIDIHTLNVFYPATQTFELYYYLQNVLYLNIWLYLNTCLQSASTPFLQRLRQPVWSPLCRALYPEHPQTETCVESFMISSKWTLFTFLIHVPVAYMTDPGQCPAVSRVTTTSSDWREKINTNSDQHKNTKQKNKLGAKRPPLQWFHLSEICALDCPAPGAPSLWWRCSRIRMFNG